MRAGLSFAVVILGGIEIIVCVYYRPILKKESSDGYHRKTQS